MIVNFVTAIALSMVHTLRVGLAVMKRTAGHTVLTIIYRRMYAPRRAIWFLYSVWCLELCSDILLRTGAHLYLFTILFYVFRAFHENN